MLARPTTLAAVLLVACAARADVTFFDDFNTGPSAQWQNQRGDWTGNAGGYDAMQPSNAPCTLSTLPFVVGNFELNVDVIAASDGGIWLHSDATGSNAVLLVIGGNSHTGTGYYFHQVANGIFSSFLAPSAPQFSQGDTIHVRVRAENGTYSVYTNGAITPATTYTPGGDFLGLVGLYDFTTPGHRYDNFSLVSPPPAVCDPIDFNGDGLFPDTQDIADFLSVFAGGPCPTGPGQCGDIDFNNDGLFPDTTDIDSLLRVFSGGSCE